MRAEEVPRHLGVDDELQRRFEQAARDARNAAIAHWLLVILLVAIVALRAWRWLGC